MSTRLSHTMPTRKRPHGFSLIELMVALTIGSLLIAGAVFVYSQSRQTYSVNETTARLQENARYVLSILEPELQLAGYYGFTNSPGDFKYIRGGSTASPLLASQLRLAAGAAPGLGGTHACRNNYAVDLVQTVEGSDTYALACAAQGGAQANADTLTIRRASTAVAPAAVNGRVQLLVSRLSPINQYIIADGALPPAPAVTANLVEIHDLIVETFYVAQRSDSRAGLPTLRRKVIAGGLTIDDQEIMPGVEDMQVQFGIDTGDYNGDGVIDPGLDSDGDGIPNVVNGIATRYVNPNFPNLNRFQVVSVRIWLLMRAEQAETGYRDTRAYVYGNRNIPARNDGFRRLLVTRTIQLRNARML